MTGCLSRYIANEMLRPYNGGLAAVPEKIEVFPFARHTHVVAVGPPSAALVYHIVEPQPVLLTLLVGDADPPALPDGFAHVVTFSTDLLSKDGLPYKKLAAFPIEGGTLAPPPGDEPIGTIIMLHGSHNHWGPDGGDAWSTVLELANAGYRLVLVNLRGHGPSTGTTRGWGALDARDLSKVIDDLQQRGLLAGRLGVFGGSYGAGVAVHAAAEDARVDAVVSIAPWGSALTWAMLAVHSAGEEDEYRTIYRLIGWALTDGTIRRAVDRMAAKLGVGVDELDQAQAIQRTTAAVLLIHGREDAHCDVQESIRIHAARPDRTKLIIFDEEDHFSLYWRQHDEIRDQYLSWLRRWLVDM